MGTDKDIQRISFSIHEEISAVSIRRCRLEDLEGVIEVNEKELPEDYPYFFYKSILDNFPDSFLVAINDMGKVIGYIMWRVEKTPSPHSLKISNKGHLVSIAISKEYRRKGIGGALLSNSMEEVKRYKIDEFVLEVRVSNYG
ncbi:MAG: GNAT family N-acetyltransferase, partial [Candidatus Heimdallarchaeota archaeon]